MVDSGILQSLWSIGFTTKSKHFDTSCHSLFDDKHRPDVVICVEAPLHIIYPRLMQRPGKNSRLEKKLDPQALNNAHFVFRQIKTFLGTVNSDDYIKIFTIDNSQEGEEGTNAKRIVDFIISEYQSL
jgi:deoxyadenosine/deoxycytidine kinase